MSHAGWASPAVDAAARYRRWLSRAVLISWLWLPIHALALLPGEVVIELPDTVELAKPSVRLGDIAVIRSGDLENIRRLVQLPLGMTPRLGNPVTVDRDSIERWIFRRVGSAGRSASSIQWTGATQVMITTASQPLIGQSIVDTAQAALSQWLGGRTSKASVTARSRVADSSIMQGTLELRARPLPVQGVVARHMWVWVDVFANGAFVRAVPVSFAIEAWVPGHVAKRALDQGEIFSNSDIQATVSDVLVDATDLRSMPAQSANSVLADATSPLRLRRAKREGEPVLQTDFERVPAVQRGAWAELHSGLGGIALTSRVEALQDGQIGHTVRVRMPSGGATVMARVTGNAQVEALQ